ncbi:MAG: lysine--tRNA ligase [Candidatus Gracilibacteria bacterium]|nr:lysine--tRNA ligase [Candidatus Gracilibacteria bacterium]
MTDTHKLVAERTAKIKLWEELGFPGYAQKFDRTHTAREAREFCEKNDLRDTGDILEKPKSKAALAGRILQFRSMGKLAFLRLRDVSGDFQVCLARNILGDTMKKLEKALDLGDFCGFEGEFFITKHGEPTLMATKVTPLAKAIRPLPEKWAGLKDREACYRERSLDLMTNRETFERFRLRSKLIREIRNWLEAKDFVEVETRILQPQAGGAMARVFETHHEALDHDFVMRIAIELDLKMAVAGGMERVFELGKNFRNEGMDPSHLQEFTMLEWYAAYEDLETNLQWTEDLLKTVVQNTMGTTNVEILNADGKTISVDFGKKYPRVTFGELLKKHAGVDLPKVTEKELQTLCVKKYDLPPEEAKKMGRGNLLDHVFKKTARPKLLQPTFVTHYPSELKPLARPCEDGTSESAQLLVAGWEITNAYGELVDPQVQRKLFEAQAKAKAAGDQEAMEVNEEFLKAMEHGFPPMTGFGMGIDRLVALLTQQPNLRDVVLFPLMKPE